MSRFLINAVAIDAGFPSRDEKTGVDDNAVGRNLPPIQSSAYVGGFVGLKAGELVTSDVGDVQRHQRLISEQAARPPPGTLGRSDSGLARLCDSPLNLLTKSRGEALNGGELRVNLARLEARHGRL
jgi:hypothetical protein